MSYDRTELRGPDGQLVEVEIIPVAKTEEGQSKYLLADGTTLSSRTVIVDVARIPDRYDENGNPIYIVRSKNVVVAYAPDELKRGGG